VSCQVNNVPACAAPYVQHAPDVVPLEQLYERGDIFVGFLQPDAVLFIDCVILVQNRFSG
jgi:hypothetical protein